MREVNVEELNSPEINLAEIKQKAVKGVVTLTGRTFFLQFISFFGFFLLTVFLNQAEIGLFFAVSELVGILGYFSDIGLAAALIQKKEEPKLKEIRSTFTIQQSLVLFLVSLIFFLTPLVRDFYHISPEGIWLLRALVFGFFLASLKTIPSVLLERRLRFEFLVLVEITETLLFYLIAVFLAWRGFGVLSYAWAVLGRGVAGVILIYLISPWKIGLSFDFTSLKELLRFGIPYQGNSFLAVIKDRLMNVILWKIIGVEGVGILGWAQKWIQAPLRFFMDPVMRVSFPAYSRIQHDKKQLSLAIEKSLFFVCLLILPMLVGMVILIKPLIFLIPKYQKWEVGILAFSLYAINSAWAAVTTPLTNALAAVGKIKTVFKLMIMWTVLTWIFYPLLAFKFGYNGVALASALVATSSIVAILAAKKEIGFNFLKSIYRPLLATLTMGIILYALCPFFAKNILSLLILVFIGGGVYFGVIYLIAGETFIEEVKRLLKDIIKK
ncbi:MAG: oligosaccharide flippase family protein [Microgenomates group bacterium]